MSTFNEVFNIQSKNITFFSSLNQAVIIQSLSESRELYTKKTNIKLNL